MSYRSTFRQLAQAAARAERHRRTLERARLRETQAHQREQVRFTKQLQKEQLQEYVRSRIEETDKQTQNVQEQLDLANTVLERSIAKDVSLDLTPLIEQFTPAIFNEEPFRCAEPSYQQFAPKPASFIGRLIPGSKNRQELKDEKAARAFNQAHQKWETVIAERNVAYDAFQSTEIKRRNAIAEKNAPITNMLANCELGEHDAVVTFYKLLLEQSLIDLCDAVAVDVGFSAESKQLVVEAELPSFDVIPEEAGFKYVKSADRIDVVPLSAVKRKSACASLVSQIALKCFDVVFRGGGQTAFVETVTLNCMLSSIDPATGQEIRPCLLSARATYDFSRVLTWLGSIQPPALNR